MRKTDRGREKTYIGYNGERETQIEGERRHTWGITEKVKDR
jgi:hypothetical protein